MTAHTLVAAGSVLYTYHGVHIVMNLSDSGHSGHSGVHVTAGPPTVLSPCSLPLTEDPLLQNIRCDVCGAV